MTDCKCVSRGDGCERDDNIYICPKWPGYVMRDGGYNPTFLNVIRSSGNNGTCDTFYGKAVLGAVACKDGKRVPMPLDLIDSIKMDLKIKPSAGNCEDYGPEFLPSFTVTGIPVIYDEFSDQFVTRFSASICGLGTSDCCYQLATDPPVDPDNPFNFNESTCYDITAEFKGSSCLENNIDLLDRLYEFTVCDPRVKQTCETEVYLDEPLSLDPFAEDGVNVNIWVIAKEAMDAQKEIPEQNGISHDDSYIGLIR